MARDPNTPDGAAPPTPSVGGDASANGGRPAPPVIPPVTPYGAPRADPPAQRLRAFLELAAIEARRYGDDDDVFVRELVQNARDAGAKVISFRTEVDGVDGVDDDDVSTFNAIAGEEQAIVGGREHLIVDDDGEGMSRDQVSRQLLRLFSSEKAERPSTAGCFGVGFWSVLRAGPEEILVDTHDGKAGCAFVIDIVNARLRELPSRRAGHGTTICLSRPGGSRTFAWRAAILQEAASVTGRNGPPPELRLITRISRADSDVNGAEVSARNGDGGSDDEAADANTETSERTEILNRPLDLAGLEGVVASTPVRGPGFRGLVGLSTRPRVELFHHGLRVVEASSLQALLPSRRHTPREGLGLAIRVDVDNLTVLLDRRSVVEDDQLKAVVLACERAATQLEHDILDNAAPLPPWRAGVARLKEVFGPRPVRVAAACALAFAVGGGGAVAGLYLVAGQPRLALPALFGDEGGGDDLTNVRREIPHGLDEAQGQLMSPRIDVRGSDRRGWAVRTREVGDDDLVVGVLAIPDAALGLRARGASPESSEVTWPVPPGLTEGEGERAVVARLVLRASGGRLILPSSLTLWPIAAAVSGVRLPVAVNADGLPFVDLDRVTLPAGAASMVVSVDLGLTTNEAPPRESRPPPLRSPALDAIVAAGDGTAGIQRINAIARAVQKRVRYAADVEAAQAFAADHRPFVERALGLGIGDCDVINTVLVRALQQAGYEARLAVGLIVRDDAVADELHAWAEVMDEAGRWIIVDASPPGAIPQPVARVEIGRPGGAMAAATQRAGRAGRAGQAGQASVATGRGFASGTLDGEQRAVGGASRAASVAASGGTQRRIPPRRESGPWTLMGAAQGEPSTTPPSVWWLMGLGIAGLALVAGLLTSSLTRLRRRDRSAIVDDDALSRLLVAGLASGASERLGLLERPVIPTRAHGFLSLKRIRRLASDGRLASSIGGEGAPWLAADVVVLDDDHPRIRRLRSFLPDRPRLDRLRGVGGVMTSGPLGVLQRRVDAAVAGVALRVVPGDAIREVLLHTVDGRRHQVLVGEDLVALNVAALAPRLLRDVSALRVMRLRELLGD